MKISFWAQSIILLALCLLGGAFKGSAQDAANQSRFTVTFRLNKGRLVVDRLASKSKFTPSEKFCLPLGIARPQCKPGSQFVAVETDLFNDIDKALSAFQKFYFYALNAEERNLDLNGKLNNDLIRQLKNFSGTWPQFRQVCDGLNANSPDRCPIGLMLNEVLNSSTVGDQNFSTSLQNNSALIPTPFGVLAEENDPFYDFETGAASFLVTDPVASWKSEQDFQVCFASQITANPSEADCKRNPKAARVHNLLAQLKTTLWRPQAMKTIIESYYNAKGYKVNVTFGSGEKRWINIQEGRLGRILLPPTLERTAIDKIVYLLLSEKQFREYHLREPKIECIEIKPPPTTNGQAPPAQKFQKIDFLNLGSTSGEEPLLNQFQLQYQQASLMALGYSIALQENAEPSRKDRAFYDLNILKAAASDEAPKPDNQAAPKPAIPDINKSGIIDAKTRGHTDFEPKLLKARAEGEDSACRETSEIATEAVSPKERKNYLALGFEYKPGQGVRGLFIGQRSKLGPGDLSAQIGGHEKALGQLNYTADFVGFNLFGHRRASLQLNGSSEFVARRILAGLQTDERRMGGMGRFELEVFRDLNGNLLRFSLEARHALVTLLRNDKSVEKQHLSTLDIGAYYLYESGPSPMARRLSLEPRLRIGFGLADKASQFTAFSMQGHYHHKLPNSLETDITGRVAAMGQKTPLFEQASFGGAEVVRGFREDDAIGRKLWSLQPELWTPIPGIRKYEEGPGAFFSQNVRLAGFVDVGGIYATTASKPGRRLGPGLGARLIYGAAIIKLDWAYGVGNAAQGRGHGRFYFSVVFNRPI